MNLEPIIAQLTPANLSAIAFLIVLEGMLSFDNALALAALVRGRLKDPKDQRHALTYGIWGAYLFRIAVIFVGVWLMEHTWVKVLAGSYLLYLGFSELKPNRRAADDGENEVGGFKLKWLTPLWSTVVAVEAMDIMFSVDSIGAALAVSSVKWVLIAGAVLGILAMRVAASGFIKLIDKFPILEKTAFVLVAIAGAAVIGKAFHFEVPEAPFIGGLFGVLLVSMAVNYAAPAKVKAALERVYGKGH